MGGRGAVPPAAPSQAGEQPAQLLPFYLLDQKHLHITSRGTGLRNMSTRPTLHCSGQEQRTVAIAATPLPPILSWGHIWNQPCLGPNACVLARSCILSPLPNRISAELSGPAHPTPCNTQAQPGLLPPAHPSLFTFVQCEICLILGRRRCTCSVDPPPLLT